MTYDVIRPFDPWKSELCTCPDKFSFNPYTGCSHGCLYCYATYIPRFYWLREKKNLLRRLEKDLKKLESPLISMSNSSDPYPSVEKQYGITRKCLEIMKGYRIKLLIVTKSDIVARDLNLLSEMQCAVSISITSIQKNPLEPSAPEPERRVGALRKIYDAGIPAILRLDPIIPYVNENSIEDIIESCSFVDHIVTSTLKLRKDSFNRVIRRLPELEGRYKKLYFECGEKIHNSWYLPAESRESILKKVVEKCREFGISYGFCREGFEFNGGSCDGSHLIIK
jgi:DNA repair photolyase